MAVPSVQGILAMLDPYKGFSTAQSAQAGIAAGNVAADSRSKRAALAQQKELALADDARAGQYLQLQQQGQQFNQKQDLNDRRMKAYAGFQAAVDAGDTEGADLAANQLRMLGVDVQQYGGEKTGTTPAAPPPARSPMPPSPTEAVAQSQAQRPPMSAKDAQTDKELDALARSATVDSGDPMQAVASASVPRPAPSRAVPVKQPGAAKPGSYEAAMEAAGKMNTPTSWAEQVGPDQWEARGGDENGNPIQETGPRPGPARAQYIKGQEPAPAGEATPKQSLIRGYRLNFDGQTIDIDPNSVAERQRQRVASSLAPLLQNASTPEEQRAATSAIQAAVASVGTLTPDKAIEYGVDLYKDPLNRSAKEKRARIVGGGGVDPKEGYGGVAGLTKDEKQRSLDAGKYARSVIRDVLTRHNVKGIREELALGEDALSKAKSPDSLAQFASKATLQKMLMKGSLSDRDVARLEGATGNWDRLQQAVNNWTEGGQLPPDVIRQIVAIAQAKNALNRQRLDAAGQAAKEDVLNDESLMKVTDPEELEGWGNTAYGTATGVFKKRSKPAGGADSAPIQRGSKAPVKGSPAERARKHGY